MSETSRGKGLSPQMRERIAAQRQEIEAQTVSELQQLSESCQQSVQHELNTIASVMAAGSAAVQKRFGRLLFWIGVLGMGLILSLSLGTWGLAAWLTSSIQSHLEERAKLRIEIAAQEATVRQLEKKTWGVGYQETAEGRFLILPAGSQPNWKVGDKPAVRLSGE